jgi:hypothetical protein
MSKPLRKHYAIVVAVRPKGGRYRASISNGMVHYQEDEVLEKLEELRAADPARADNYQMVEVMLP